MSVAYRDRDRDRYDDSRTSISSARRDNGYTTVKRYVVKDDDNRSSYGRDRRNDRGAERVEETKIIRREREVDDLPRESRRDEPRVSQSELVIRREDDSRRDRDYGYDRDRRRDDVSTDKELVIRRTTDREDSRRDDLAMSRYDDRRDYRDDYELSGPNRGGFGDRDVRRYTRSMEYFTPQPAPQTIIIRNEPIIIRERARGGDDDFQIVRKSDIDEERSVARREPDRPSGPRDREEEYFYEKKVRERIDEPRRGDRGDREDREDDFYERRSTMRREVSPHDSVSQVGRGRNQDYSSDDSMVYVRKEVRESSRDSSPDHRKNLAAGVIAGVGAAELLRNHKKKEGRHASDGVGRLGRDLGAGALGAIAAEGITRARSLHRSRSRRRDRERDRSDSRSRSRSRRRSRSESRHRLRNLGAVGLGAAALATAVAVAQRRKNNDDGGRIGRSQSRNRHSDSDLVNDPSADDARNPKHRNIRMAEAGAAGAAITALIDRARSKSRGGKGKERSRSRVRQGLPVIAAGLGSAALAGLYEKNKAKKEANTIAHEERRARSRSRSRARSDAYYDGPREGTMSDPGLIEYGNGPMYGNNFGTEYYGRPQAQDNFYGPQNAVVPAAAAGAAYGASETREARSRSVSRDRRDHRSGSLDSAAGAAAGAGAGAGAASDHDRKKQEKRERKTRRRQEEQYQREQYEAEYNHAAQQYTPTPPPAADPYAFQSGFYPQTSQFPPPPGAMPEQYPVHAQAGGAGPQYGPQDFPPPPPATAPGVAGYDAYASGGNPYAPHRGTDNNVSAVPNPSFGDPFPHTIPNSQHQSVSDGLNTTRAADSLPSINVQPPSVVDLPSQQYTNPDRSGPNTYIPPTDLQSSQVGSGFQSESDQVPRKSVQFADSPPGVATARGYEAGDDTDTPPEDRQRRRNTESNLGDDIDSVGDMRKHRHHHRRRSHEPSTAPSSVQNKPMDTLDVNRTTSPASDVTEELPARFDDRGRRRVEPGEDPLADRLDDILAGRGTTGRMFGNFMNGIFGPDGRRRR